MNSSLLLLPILGAFLGGGLCLLIPRSQRFHSASVISALVTGAICALSIQIWLSVKSSPILFEREWLGVAGIDFRLLAENLNSLILLATGGFAFLLSFFSIQYMAGKPRLNEYYAYFLFTLGAASGAILADNLIVLIFFWEILVVTLYGLVGIYGGLSLPAARKSLLMVGVADFFLLLGVGLLYSISGTFNMSLIVATSLRSPLAVAAFLFIAVGAFTKIGVMPFHTWIPAASLAAPQSVMAFLPGALDKLLGVYLLARLCLHFFDISSALGGPIVLLLLGSLTIVVGALMAVLQKDFRRMLAYLAISSSGYMVLGLASGSRIGTAGGLFHMLNGALYMSLLFLVAAAVEKKTGKTSLEELGGLSYAMPLTFVVFLIGGMAMSGVPPLSGFFSKWMIYQGLISAGTHVSLFPFFLIAALFGSVLTLACFLKLAHSVFLGHREEKAGDSRETNFWMGLPQIVMAVLTIVFGVFAIQIPLRHLIYPSVDYRLYDVYGWNPGLATLLLLVGLVVGALVYIAGRVKPKVSGSFIGGESLEPEEVRMPGTDFYRTSMTSIDLFDKTYEVGEQGAFDIFIQGMAVLRGAGRFLYQFIDRPLNQFYDFLATLALLMGRGLSELHTGGLRFYLAWILGLGGTVVLVMVLLFG